MSFVNEFISKKVVVKSHSMYILHDTWEIKTEYRCVKSILFISWAMLTCLSLRCYWIEGDGKTSEILWELGEQGCQIRRLFSYFAW